MKICMIVPDTMVKGGIASVVNGYRSHGFGDEYEIVYVESYCDGSKWNKLVKAIRGYREFAGQLRKNSFDIVHVHSSFGPSFYRKMPFICMASAKGIPVINHIHGADFDVFYEKASAGKKKLIKKIYLKCGKLIALSEEWKDNLKKIVPEEKIAVIENYCLIPELEGRPEDRGKNKDTKILFLGEIGKRKGCFDIPYVLTGVNEKAENFRFVMAGDGLPEDVDAVKKLMEDCGLNGKAEFPGWVRGIEKEKLLRTSDIFFFPSYHEGMPMAVLEAMAYGKAIVTTRTGGIPKLIEDGISGYLCEPGNVKEMTEGLLKLIRRPEKIQEFGKKARAKAINCYSFEEHLKKLLALYQSVAGRE